MPRRGVALRLCLAFVSTTATAAAQEPPPSDEAPRNFANLRVGVSSADRNRRPQLCLEGSPWAPVSLEACGTGAGFLHRDPEAELAHFRLKVRFLAAPLEKQWIEAFAAAGFAELQIGADAPGFDFGGTDEGRTASAGPEAGLSLRMPVPLEADLELVVDLNASVAWIPHADELLVPLSEVQPSASLTLGLGS